MTDVEPSLPAYADLPLAGAPPGSSWGVWGDSDRLGCLNLLTPERARRGAGCVRDGSVFRLDLPLDQPDPPLYGRARLQHEVIGQGGHDDVIGFNTQASTQWDGFRHIAHPEHGHYGGLASPDHGIEAWQGRIVGRAVLADVAAWREAHGRPLQPGRCDPISPDDLLATLDEQGTAVEPGDVLLVRTGWLEHYDGLTAAERAALPDALTTVGLAAGEATAAALWDLHVSAVAADNPALEAWPPDFGGGPDGFLHYRLLPLLGIPIGELFRLGPLAAHCRATGRYDALFTSAPLVVPAGVASPPGALAVT